MQCESRNLNFYKISITKPKIAVAFPAASAYMAAIGIAGERWKTSVARNCRNRFLLLTTDVLALVRQRFEEGRRGLAPAFFVGRPAGRELRLNTMAAHVATSSLLVELRFAPIGVKQTFSLKIERRSSGRRPAAITHATKRN
ncbi:hypothetical protein B5K05_23645 [Rhizobium phaseoli]|nr:hypothetical protein B5K04_23580 [Rhizobium phaseoli]RDJ07017.1 hypothetical protein B5K05_23645 [Rhizobium phaseoli]